MGKPCSCTQFIKSRIFYCKSRENPYQYCESRENPYQVLQVTRESVSGTTSHVRCVWTCNEIEGSYDKIIITIVPSYTGKNITRLLPLALLLVLRTRNNTDGNKLVIFSGIALYYGDNYIVQVVHQNGGSFLVYGIVITCWKRSIRAAISDYWTATEKIVLTLSLAVGC